MNLAIHQKINGLEAIKIWTNGGFVYDAHGAKYAIDKEDGLLWYTSPFYRCGYDRTFNEIIKNDWYIKKPFDVRQAMRDKPDEWVGIVEKPNGGYLKIGFDSKRFRAVAAYDEYEGKPSDQRGVMLIDSSYLDNCEDIELRGDEL